MNCERHGYDNMNLNVMHSFHELPECQFSENMVVRALFKGEESKGNAIGVIMIKPQPSDEIATYYAVELESELINNGLSILSIKEKSLLGHEVIKLYQELFVPKEDEPAWEQAFRDQLYDYMTSGPVRSYLISGKDVVTTSKNIRDRIRAKHIPTEFRKRPKNIVHAPEENDVDLDLSILFEY